MSDCRLPVRSRSRLMSSSHTETPASERCPRTSTDTVLFPSCAAQAGVDAGQTVACGGGYPLRGDAKLHVNLLLSGRGAVVVYSDRGARSSHSPHPGGAT